MVFHWDEEGLATESIVSVETDLIWDVAFDDVTQALGYVVNENGYVITCLENPNQVRRRIKAL